MLKGTAFLMMYEFIFSYEETGKNTQTKIDVLILR